MSFANIPVDNAVRVTRIAIPGSNPVVPTVLEIEDLNEAGAGVGMKGIGWAYLVETDGDVVAGGVRLEGPGGVPLFNKVTATPPTTDDYGLVVMTIG
jgi:hypothetical protein